MIMNCHNNKKEKFIWDLRNMVARKISNNMWGSGFLFQAQDEKMEKVFKKFSKINKFENMCSYAERQLSLYGRVIITINKTKTGEILLNVPNPFYYQGVGKVFIQPQLAVIWQRFTIDSVLYVVKSTYDCEKVVNELYTRANETNIRVFDKEAEIFKMLNIEKVWKHNLGFPPIVELTNLSFYQFNFNNEEYLELADWYPAQEFEQLIWNAITNLKKELHYCHTRVALQDAPQELITQLKLTGAKEEIDLSDMIIETGMGADVKVVNGNGDFSKYTNTINDLLDFYLKFCGGAKFSEGGGAQKTVAETSTIRSNLIESINNKIILRQAQYKELIKKVLCSYGLIKDYWDDEEYFNFEINGNVNKDETKEIDNLIKQVESGFMSTQEAIQTLRKVTNKEAEEIFQEVKEFNENNNIMLLGSGNMEQDNNESGFDKETGEHKNINRERGLD